MGKNLTIVLMLTGATGACGSAVTLETDPSGSGTGAGGTTSSSTTGGGGTPSLCPAAPPTNGSSCSLTSTNSNASAHCSWGDDPRPLCRTTALCAGNSTWTVTPPDATACSVPPLPAACDTQPPSAGSTCADTTLACWYDDGARCWCSDCQGGTQYPVCQTIDPPEWACASPAAGCPSSVPQAGSACSTADLSCGPNCELTVVCENGFWVWKNGDCPICAAPNTPIATPTGERPIASLRVGDLVYSVDHHAIVAVPIARIGSTPVTRHQVMRVTLQSGAVLEISPGHPTADGRRFEDLHPGSALDGQHRVVSAELVPYVPARTYDIRPDSTTGHYFAAGALIGSTLAPTRQLASSHR